MAGYVDQLVSRQKEIKEDLETAIKNGNQILMRDLLMKGMAEFLAIQYVLDHGEYANIANSDDMDPVDALVRKRTDVLLHGTGIADYTTSDMVRLLTDENGLIRSTEEIWSYVKI